MKNYLLIGSLCLVAVLLSANESFSDKKQAKPTERAERIAEYLELVHIQPKLLRISATVDGSGKISFTHKKVQYQHKHWGGPKHVLFDGEPWTKLSHTPPAWTDYQHRLDLTMARIVKRKGRDIIALEHTPDGFDLYLSDSPNGASHYEVIVAIPRR